MRYVIIGNGVAGVTAAFTLRERDQRAAITLISGESEYFFSRTALMYSFMDRMSIRDLEPYERKVYDRQAVERRTGWVKNLNAETRDVTMASGEKIPYDRLLLATGSVPNRPAWSGLEASKDGVVHFVSLQDLEDCERLAPSTRDAVVVGGGLIGVELVECLLHHGKQVNFLVREPWYWPAALDNEEGSMVSGHLRHHGVNVHLDEQVSEVLNDHAGRVWGIRTQSGKEMPCQMLGVAVGVRPAIDWLRDVDTPPALGRGIQVHGDFRTSLPDVYAAGDCAEFAFGNGKPLVEQIWYSAKRQGAAAARAMLGDDVSYQPPVFYNSSKFFEIEYTTVGKVNDAPDGARSFFYRVPGREASVRIVAHDRCVIGFNMLGARWDHGYFERWILERRSLDDVIGMLPRAQFDVEFGRTSLAGVGAAYLTWKSQENRRG